MKQFDSGNGIWELLSDNSKDVNALSVFGTKGNRFSILVFPRESVPIDFAGKNGAWIINNSSNETSGIRFTLQWAADAGGSGCVILCGREAQQQFISTA
ncbi:MAG: hypothetical protein KAQ97_08885 [Candidatus Fermentibacteraceae bacterium]|nr:hypothetical protein [Candidatus Fermentibacteraceae bacterium]